MSIWEVELTDIEIDEMRKLAVRRQGIKDSIGVSTRRFYKDRAEEDTVGLLGEYAF